MHICYIEAGYPHRGGGGGAGTYVRLVGQELCRRGHRVTVISRQIEGIPDVYDDGPIQVHRLPWGNLHWYFSRMPAIGRCIGRPLRSLEYGWRVTRKIQDIHARNPIDIVEFSEFGNLRFACTRPCPYLVHLHGSSFTYKKYCGEPIGLGDQLERWLEGFLIRRAQYLISPSRFLLDEATSEFGIDHLPMEVVPLPLPSQLADTPLAKCQERGRPQSVFFVGRIEPRKGADVLLRAIPLVTARYKPVVFEFFGGGSSSLPRAEIHRFLDAHNLHSQVRFHEFIPYGQLLNEYRRADICVIPSRWDNSPYAVYEAMGAAKAVVASRVGGIPELVEHGMTGLLVPPNDHESLAEAILELLRDDVRREQMGRLGHERIIRLANLKDNVDRRVAIYERIIQESQGI